MTFRYQAHTCHQGSQEVPRLQYSLSPAKSVAVRRQNPERLQSNQKMPDRRQVSNSVRSPLGLRSVFGVDFPPSRCAQQISTKTKSGPIPLRVSPGFTWYAGARPFACVSHLYVWDVSVRRPSMGALPTAGATGLNLPVFPGYALPPQRK